MSLSLRPPSRPVIAVLLPLFLASFVVNAEEPPPPTSGAPASAKPPSAISVQVVAGSSLGGPEEALQEKVDSPDTSVAGRLSLWFAGRSPIGKGRWQAGLGCAWTNLGDFEGRPAGRDGASASNYVTVKTSILSAGPMLWLDAAPALQLGVGPMLHVIDVDTGVSTESGVAPPEGTNRRWRAGLLAEAAIRFPVDRPLYVVLLGQYRWIPDTTVDVPARQGSVPVQVPLSHGLVAAGFGVRF